MRKKYVKPCQIKTTIREFEMIQKEILLIKNNLIFDVYTVTYFQNMV